MTEQIPPEARIVPFPVRSVRPVQAQAIATAQPAAMRLGAFGLVLFALATALMTAVIPLVLLGAFLGWCGLMALLTAIDAIPERLRWPGRRFWRRNGVDRAVR